MVVDILRELDTPLRAFYAPSWRCKALANINRGTSCAHSYTNKVISLVCTIFEEFCGSVLLTTFVAHCFPVKYVAQSL